MLGVPLLRQQRSQGGQSHSLELRQLDAALVLGQHQRHHIRLLLHPVEVGHILHHVIKLLQHDIHPAAATISHDGGVEEKHLIEGGWHLHLLASALLLTRLPASSACSLFDVALLHDRLLDLHLLACLLPSLSFRSHSFLGFRGIALLHHSPAVEDDLDPSCVFAADIDEGAACIIDKAHHAHPSVDREHLGAQSFVQHLDHGVAEELQARGGHLEVQVLESHGLDLFLEGALLAKDCHHVPEAGHEAHRRHRFGTLEHGLQAGRRVKQSGEKDFSGGVAG
mmetsp:Transcript_93861/g.223227  ORF Transcript_93861/g.223227 Transcript_93861/m.223227 type:complete len:281 (+) Transcript_93861:2218-3060(+)